jgi:hypothetical protein
MSVYVDEEETWTHLHALHHDLHILRKLGKFFSIFTTVKVPERVEAAILGAALSQPMRARGRLERVFVYDHVSFCAGVCMYVPCVCHTSHIVNNAHGALLRGNQCSRASA